MCALKGLRINFCRTQVSTANPQAAGSGHSFFFFFFLSQDEQENSRSLCLPFHSSDFPFGEARLNSVSTSLMIQAFRAQ